MWALIIIVIVILIIKFVYDSNKQNVQVIRQGGMRHKYSILVNYIMQQDQRVRIIKETSNSIDLGMVNAGGASSFFLTQTYGNLTVQWKIQSPIYGKHEMEWGFPEFLDQGKMIERLNNDLGKYQMNVVTK